MKGRGGADSVTNIGFSNIIVIVNQIIRLALDLAGVVAFIMILYSVFLFATSYGEEGKIESAKKTLYWSIVGLAVVASGYFLTELIKKYLK